MIDVVERSTTALRRAYRGNVQSALDAIRPLVEEVRGFDDPALLSLCLYDLGRIMTLAQWPGDALAAHEEALTFDRQSPIALSNLLAR